MSKQVNVTRIDASLHQFSSTADKSMMMKFITLTEMDSEMAADLAKILKSPKSIIIGDQNQIDELIKVMKEAASIIDVEFEVHGEGAVFKVDNTDPVDLEFTELAPEKKAIGPDTGVLTDEGENEDDDEDFPDPEFNKDLEE